jgi:hypothetical protein
MFLAALRKASPYLFRAARAFAYATACYFLLWLQPHFDFSFLALALGVFFLAIVRRTTFLAELALGLILLSIFTPVGLLRSLSDLF